MKTTTVPTQTHLIIEEVNAPALRFMGSLARVAVAAIIAALIQPTLAAEPSLESAPPVVVQTVPVAGATGVDPALSEIHVTFSKFMQEGKAAASPWDKEHFPESAGAAHFQDEGRTCVLPVKLAPDRFYALWLNTAKAGNFKDAAGQPAVPYLLTFSTGSESAHPAARSDGAKYTTKLRHIVNRADEQGARGESRADKGYEYAVQPGDTLSLIAEVYRAKGLQVTVDQIIKANPGLSPAKLRVGQKLFIPAPANPASGSAEERLQALVEDFFAHNYRDITARDTLEWGPVGLDAQGNSFIRYRYRAKIWDKDTVTNHQEFTFDPQGKYVSAKDVYGSQQERMVGLVEKFFANNFRDVTARETLEWGTVAVTTNGLSSIRYKYRAKIWDRDTVTNEQVFTFDGQDKFVSVDDLAKAARPAPAIDPAAVRTYTLSRKVSDFPTNEDLSTPEAAYAVFSRACASGDQAVWGRLSIASIARNFPAEAQPKPVSAKAAAEWLGAEVVEVNLYRDTFAEVFARVPHPTKTIVDIRALELHDGRWLNAGNDVVGSLEEARKLFARRCGFRDAAKAQSK